MKLTALLAPVWRTVCAAGAAGAIALAGAAAADSIEGGSASVPAGGKTVTEELLDIMLQAGTINRSQYDALLTRAHQEEQARADAARSAASAAVASAARATPEVAADKPQWSFKWDNGFKLKRDDGAFAFKFGGRLQLDTASIWEDTALRNALGGTGFGTEFRRARLFFEGEAWEHLVFKAQYDFAGSGTSSPQLKDLFIGFRELGPVQEILAGHQKEAFSLEELTSSKYITFMERSLINVFAPSRNTGIQTKKNFLDKKLLAQFGVFQETNDQAFSFSRMRDWNLVTRAVAVPIYENEGATVLHLGFGYTHRFANENAPMRYRQRPESHLAMRFVDTGSVIPADNIDQINPELALVLGPFSLQAEYIGNWASNVGVVPGTMASAPDTYFWGTYVEASYFLTGEHRTYKLGSGHFDRVKPSRNFNPLEGDCGAWQIAARYSYLDLNDEFVRGGTIDDMTIGLNWYPYPNTRLMLNYIHSWLNNRAVSAALQDLDGQANIFQARFQVDF